MEEKDNLLYEVGVEQSQQVVPAPSKEAISNDADVMNGEIKQAYISTITMIDRFRKNGSLTKQEWDHFMDVATELFERRSLLIKMFRTYQYSSKKEYEMAKGDIEKFIAEYKVELNAVVKELDRISGSDFTA